MTFRSTTANGRTESHIKMSDTECQQLRSQSKGRMGGMVQIWTQLMQSSKVVGRLLTDEEGIGN